MVRAINGFNSTKLQIEDTRTDTYAPNGIALSNGRYDILQTDLANVLPMGITKSGDQLAVTSTMTKITNWTITDAATVLSSDSIVVQDDFYGMVMLSVGYAKPSIGYSKLEVKLAVRVNGVTVKEYSHVRLDSDMFYIGSFKAGDIVSFHTSYFASRRVPQWVNGKYVYVTQVATGKLLASKTNAWIKKYRRDAIDPVYDLVYPANSAIYYGVTSQSTGRAPDYGKEQLTFYDASASSSADITLNQRPNGDWEVNRQNVSTSVNKSLGFSWGPILAQSRQPLPVEPGYLVDFTGKFRMRGFGEVQKDKNDVNTAIKVRFSLWGVVNQVDEYGTERADRELIFEEFAHTNTFTVRDYTISKHDPIEIPDDITEVYFTCALKADTTDEYQSARYKTGGVGPAYNTFFLIYNDNPLIIDVQMPEEEKTYEHPLSETGVAFKFRKWFDNMTEAKQLTFYGKPDESVTISIYESTEYERGSLIASYTANANERKTITISSATGQIELDSTRYMPSNTYGMDKSGTQALGVNTWTDLTPFTLRTGHTGTITSNNTWVATEDCVANISGSITFGSTAADTITKGYRVLVNNQVVAVNTNEDDTTSVASSNEISLQAGDTVKFQAFTSSTTAARRVVQTSTYFTMTFVEQQHEYFVESVVPVSYDTIDETQNHIERITWTDISDPLSGIVASRDESAIGKLQLKFVSNELANGDLLVPGNKVRMLMNHYGEALGPGYSDLYEESYEDYNVVFTGMIRDYTVKYDYKNRPFIEVTVEDANRLLLDTDAHYFYDLPIEYAPMLNTSGNESVINGLDVSGPWQAEADSPKNQPSAYVDGTKMQQSLKAMRNTNNGFLYVDRYNRITYRDSIEAEPVLTIADHFSRSDLSYGKIEKGTDTQSVINKIKPNEYKFDLEAMNDLVTGSEMPPKVEKLQSMAQVAEWFYDSSSIRAYGEREATFDVVRGTGRMEDVKFGRLGGGFKEWSFAICDDYQLAKNRISRIMVVPDNFYDLKRLSELEIFDPIMIMYKNENHVVYIRKMEWTIVENAVRLELFFSRDSSGVAWTPDYELSDSFTDIFFDLF